MSRRCWALLLLVSVLVRCRRAEYSSKIEQDYEFGDYRGKWCLDDHGFVYGIGEVYYPSPSACPCTCTADGPVCVRPRCPRVHHRCTRIRYRACCPVCEAMARVCVYRGKTYRLLEEFWLSRCERCRCGANREVYCTISDCPAPHCVNPTYEPNHCCPICKTVLPNSPTSAVLSQRDLASDELHFLFPSALGRNCSERNCQGKECERKNDKRQANLRFM